jgi:hypothetical protein
MDLESTEYELDQYAWLQHEFQFYLLTLYLHVLCSLERHVYMFILCGVNLYVIGCSLRLTEAPL